MTLNYSTSAAPSNITTNTTNSITVEPTPTDDAIVVSVWSVILVYALITNTLTVIGILRSRSMRRATSYWIVVSLAVCDLFMIVISLVHLMPATYLHEEFVDVQSQRTIWAMFVYNIFWYTGVVQLAAMAVNRFVSIVFPLSYKRLFAPGNTLLIIGLLYLVGLAASAPSLHPCCHLVYESRIYVTNYWPETSQYMWVDIFINTASVFAMIVCYAAILVRVRQSTLTRRRYQLSTPANVASNSTVLLLAATTAASSSNSATSPRKIGALILNGGTATRKFSKGVLKPNLSAMTLSASTSSTCNLANDTDHLKQVNNNNYHDNGTGARNSRQCKNKRLAERRCSASPSLLRCKSPIFLREPSSAHTVDTRVVSSNSKGAARQQTTVAHPHQPAHGPQQASRREIRLFVQFFVVSLVFLSTWVTWQWLPRIPNASKWIYFSTTTFFFINNAVNPTVYLIFNSGLRHQVKMLLCLGDGRGKKASRAGRTAGGAGAGGGGPLDRAGNPPTNNGNTSSENSNNPPQTHQEDDRSPQPQRKRMHIIENSYCDYSPVDASDEEARGV